MPKLPLLAAVLSAALIALAPARAAADDKADAGLSKMMKTLESNVEQIKAASDQLMTVDPVSTRKAMHTFQHPGDLQEKIRAASELSFDLARLDAPKDAKNPFTAAELATLKEAATFYRQEVQRSVDAFEAGLTPEEITFITKDNPDAIGRRLNRLYLFGTRAGCSRQALDALKKKIDLVELQGKGTAVMVLSSMYEDKFMKRYLARVNLLLNERAKYRKERPVLKAYYVEASQQGLLDDSDVAERTARHEQELVQAGVKRERIKSYVLERAAASPECLGHLNIPFVKLLKQDVLIERGKYLLKVVKDQIVKTGKRPEDTYQLPIQEGHPIFGEQKDPYGSYYAVKYTGRTVSIVSPGPDAELGTADDVVAATDELP